MTGAGDERALEGLLDEQLAYYRARAREYDDWFLRRGAWDRGPDANRRWREQLEVVRAALTRRLEGLPEDARILELACGTGLWTERLAARAGVDALDAAPEVIAVCQERLERAGLASRVRWQQANLFDWRPSRRYALVFFGFWLSHVPDARFEAFWRLVDGCLEPGGRFFFVDNLRGRARPASEESGERARRRLSDGREFEIVKVFHEPEPLARRLSAMGYPATVRGTEEFFLYGWGGRA